MRKEILIAIIAGILFGLVVAFGIWRTNNALNGAQTERKLSTPQTQEKKQLPENGELLITIASPEENDIVWENPINISGITKPETLLIISAEDEDYILRSDKSGEFSQEIKLKAGVNQILISAQDSLQNVSGKDLTFVYSTEFAKQLNLQ